MLHLSALSSLFTSLFSKSLFTDIYVTASGLEVLLWVPLLCFGLHCLQALLNADKILHWLVWQSVQLSKIRNDENPQGNGLCSERPPKVLDKFQAFNGEP